MSDPTSELLVERNKTHGDFAECAFVSQSIMRVMRGGSAAAKWNDVQTEALQMIAMKLHRIACGDPDVEDHWRDVAGYAVLVADDIKKKRG